MEETPQSTPTSTLASPPPVDIAAPAPQPAPAPAGPPAKMAEGGELEGGKANWHFSSKDIMSILFFTVGVATFSMAIIYFRNRRSLILKWQQEANDEITALKGKVKSIESKVKPKTQDTNANW